MYRYQLFTFVFLLLVGCNDSPEPAPVEEPTPDLPDPSETVFTLDEDLTWSEDTVVSGVWYVAPGVTLRIEPGVEVSLLPGTGLVVDGVLLVAGTQEAPVRFTNASTLSVGNFGVSVGGSGDLSQLEQASFDGVSLYLEGGAAPSITGAQFTNASLVVSGRTERFEVIDSHFADGQGQLQDGIVATEVASLSVSGSTFLNLANGILFDGGGTDPELVVGNSSFERMTTAITSGLGGLRHRVDIDTVTVTDTSDNALSLSNAVATVRNSAVSGADYHGIHTDRVSSLSLIDTSVSGTIRSCISALGSLDAEGVTVSGCGDAGLWTGTGGCAVRDSSFADTGGYGVRCEGVLSIDGTTIQDTGRSAISAVNGVATVTGVTISSARGSGVESYAGDVYVSGSTINDVDESGVLAQYGSVIISDTSISESRLYGLRAVVGDISVLAGGGGVSLSDVGVHGVVGVDGNLNTTSLSLSDIGGIGIYCAGGDVTLTDTTVSTTGSHGVSVSDGNASLVATDGPVEVLSAGGAGIAVSGGNLSADGFIVRNSFGAGVDLYDGQGLLSSCLVENAGSHGIAGRTSPSLSVSSCSIVSSYNHGITLNGGGNLVVASSTVESPGLTGISGYRVSTQVTDSSVVSPGQNGIYVYNGSLSVLGAVISNATTYGIYSSLSDTTLDGVQIVDLSLAGDQFSAGAIGITVANASATISNTLVDKAQSYGISMMAGSVTASTISNGDYTGIYLSGHGAASISDSNITGNLFRGIHGISIGANLIDVTGNNITGNGDYGLTYLQDITGNYVADNKGFVGADTTSGGTLDGVRDTHGTQIYGADVINAPAAAVLTGTGPLAL
jgi:hypothetical protein